MRRPRTVFDRWREAPHFVMGGSNAGKGHVVLGFAAVALIPLLILSDTGLALTRGWQIQSRLDMAVLALAAFALFGALTWLSVPALRASYRRRRKEIVLLISTLSLTGLAAEWGVSLLYAPQPPDELLLHRRWPHLQRVFHPDPKIMPGVFGPSRYTTNAMGIRGPELPDRAAAIRILCLGGSTTECLYLDDEEAWPQLVAVELNRQQELRPVWVGNTGIAGYSAAQHLKFVEEANLTAEFDCLLLLVGINDFTGYLLQRDAAAPRETEKSGAGQSAPLWTDSAVLNLMRVGWHRLFGSYDVEDPQGANYEVRRRVRREAQLSEQGPPGLEERLAEYRAMLRRLIEGCRARGVQVVFATQPVLWKEGLSPAARDLLWMGALPGGKFLSVEKLREGIERYNEALQEVCREEQVGCIDLSLLHGQEALYYDDCHFNEKGARAVAQVVARWFAEHARECGLAGR